MRRIALRAGQKMQTVLCEQSYRRVYIPQGFWSWDEARELLISAFFFFSSLKQGSGFFGGEQMVIKKKIKVLEVLNLKNFSLFLYHFFSFFYRQLE